MIRPAVSARGLTKRFGDFTAVDGIDFDVAVGECVGFLGPNGAGKTTTVKMIAALSPITAGSVEVFGLDVAARPREVKALVGVCPQEDNLDPDFTVEKNLTVFARYFDVTGPSSRTRTERILERMALIEKRKARIDELSGGMRRRLVLARALLNEPRLLLLDEPTTGLDPQARQAIWHRIRQLQQEDVTVLLTTHYMEEASQLCDRVVLMDRARILLEGRPSDLVRREAGEQVVEVWSYPESVRGFVRERGWTHQEDSGRLYIYDPEGSEVARRIGETFPHQERLLRHATLEDVFLLRAGRTLQD